MKSVEDFTKRNQSDLLTLAGLCGVFDLCDDYAFNGARNTEVKKRIVWFAVWHFYVRHIVKNTMAFSIADS
jgi:hypothetical protein